MSSDEGKSDTDNEKEDDEKKSAASFNTCSSGNCWDENNLGYKKLTRKQFLAIDERIETRVSALHGNGVFVKSGMTIPAFTIVTYYAGEKTLFNHLNSSPPPTSRVYCIRIGKYTINAQCIVNSVNSADNNHLPLAHLINSSHPALPSESKTPNCKFICVDVEPEDNDSAKVNDKEVVVMATKTLAAGEELLVDYHWILSYHTMFREQLLTCSCAMCVPNITTYYRSRGSVEQQRALVRATKRRKLDV